MRRAANLASQVVDENLQYYYDCWMQKIKKHRFLMLNEATEIGVLRISGGLCAYIEFRHSKNAEISTLKWSSLCIKPLQKMEFIGSSRQKFQNHCLQNH